MPRQETSAVRRSPRRTWRTFSAREGREIERQLQRGRAPCCPGCGEVLESQASSRLIASIPIALGAWGYDLDCRACRRFWCYVVHSERSLRLMRMRRLAAAVRSGRGAPTASPAVISPVAA